jgi:hypothetical protein
LMAANLDRGSEQLMSELVTENTPDGTTQPLSVAVDRVISSEIFFEIIALERADVIKVCVL